MYTRLPVGHAARHIAAGYDLEQYRDWYPNGLTDRDILAAVKAVIALQRPDGGWAQTDQRDSDAYATGEALLALSSSGAVQATDSVYRRGVEYLLRTQQADGSWHVKTRAYPFQPLIDTGYPHGRDQWISAAGTSYALMALMTAAQ